MQSVLSDLMTPKAPTEVEGLLEEPVDDVGVIHSAATLLVSITVVELGPGDSVTVYVPHILGGMHWLATCVSHHNVTVSVPGRMFLNGEQEGPPYAALLVTNASGAAIDQEIEVLMHHV
jgi:hypothetical protein